MINFINFKNQIIGYALAIIALMLAIFHIRSGGANAQKQKYAQNTLENVGIAKQAHDDNVQLLNNPDERIRLRTKWRTPRK